MKTDESTWLQEQFEKDAPAILPLEGREVLARGRRRRRTRRIVTGAPAAGAAALALGAGLWAGGLLPEPVQEVLPAAPNATSMCPELAPDSGSSTGDGATTEVLSDVTHLGVLDWRATDGTHVLVIRVPTGCVTPSGEAVATAHPSGISVLSQAPGGPVLLHRAQDHGEDADRGGAAMLEVPGQDSVVAVVPPTADQVVLTGQDPADDLVSVVDEDGRAVAKVARMQPRTERAHGLLWNNRGESDWAMIWSGADVVTVPVPEEWGSLPSSSATPDSPSSTRYPQLARDETDGRWWLWMGGSSEVLGPVDAPQGPWAAHLRDEDLGDAFVGWVPEGTEQLHIDGGNWDLLAMEQTVGTPLEGLTPFARDVYAPAEDLSAVGSDGDLRPIPLIELPTTD